MTTLSAPQMAALIAVMAAATIITRFLPFWLFPASRPVPGAVRYLGRVLPYAVSALLVVYCLKGVSPTVFPYGLPEALSILLIALLYRWKSNVLLSIAGGSVCYVLLIQTVFR
ncbi:MAG: branched-chain amino acid transporter AzlD [Oscillospiraceae bacterium]|nr:MAG: branched-chain amino acid transporter AzlD [Oscillospiraceae bacterium]